MQVYFCGSIRGKGNETDRYADYIEDLENFEVLSEHVGDSDVEGPGIRTWRRENLFKRLIQVVTKRSCNCRSYKS